MAVEEASRNDLFAGFVGFACFDVDGVFLGELVLFVAGDEGEGVDVFVEVGKGKLEGGGAELVEEGEAALFFGIEIDEALENWMARWRISFQERGIFKWRV